MRKVELLAPAGNFQCLVAAVQSGADAVYLAGKSFGARSFADNFDNDGLEKAVDYCHLRDTKVYVTVNTLVLDNEMQELADYLRFLSRIGTDAIIVQDLGVLSLAKKVVPDLPIHASTQMTIHNSEGVIALEKYGVKRVVLSRELSMTEIASISEKTDMELEVFGHGALCMCYSGQCLLSSIIGSRSGNRGKCAQPCRLQYSINKNREKAFYMSLKDLSSLQHLQALEKAGVSSLKIEGRMKGPAYVAAVVGVYRKYIDNPQKVKREDIELLDRIFNRGGLTDGYLTGQTGKEMFALNKPDNPYLKGGNILENELLSFTNGENRKQKIKGRITVREGIRPVLEVSCGDVAAESICPQIPERAMKTALDASSVLSQLTKTGGTAFEFEDISAEVEDGLFLSAGVLNAMRRDALEKLEKAVVLSFKRPEAQENIVAESHEECRDFNGFVCEITTENQLSAVKNFDFEKFFVPIGIIKRNRKLTDDIKEKTVIVLPAILREESFGQYVNDTKMLLRDGYCGVQIHNISLLKHFEGFKVFGGFRLNIFNTASLEFFKERNLVAAEISPELTLKQIAGMRKILPVQVMAYGRLPLMVSENCIIRNGNDCPCNGENFITDRMGMKFPVTKDGDICRSVVLNCKKTFMGFDIEKMKSAGICFFRIYFTDEDSAECKKICETFLNGGSYRPDDFTNGHFYKGVAR